jgi:hypothetical protein
VLERRADLRSECYLGPRSSPSGSSGGGAAVEERHERVAADPNHAPWAEAGRRELAGFHELANLTEADAEHGRSFSAREDGGKEVEGGRHE